MQGLCVEYLDKLKNFCSKKENYIKEDAAPALGTFLKGKSVGSFGDFATFSFHETKNYQSGIGGLLVVNNKDLERNQIWFLIKALTELMLFQIQIIIRNIILGLN